MPIKFTYDNSVNLIIPYFEGGGIHAEFCSYLACRKKYPYRIGKNLRGVSSTTLKNIAYRVKFLIDLLEYNNLELHEITFEDDIQEIIKSLYEDWDWTGESIRLYSSTWRQFFDFLTIDNTLHKVLFPPKATRIIDTDKENDFFSHARGDSRRTVEQETSVNLKWMIHKDDYCDEVLSMDQYWKLYSCLYEVDPVFAVIASTMFQTFLRVGGVIQFPLTANKQNPQWKRFAEMERDNVEYQRLKFVNKGQSFEKCLVHIHTMEIIDSQYLKPCYQDRKSRFVEKYLNSKHAKKKNISIRNEYIWLNKNGAPVTIEMIQSAFRTASVTLGYRVHPHMLRHSGATHLLWRYAKANGIELHESMAGDIHSWLKYQLCHNDLSTTKRYIKTVHRLKATSLLSSMLPGQIEELETSMGKDVIASYKKAMKAHNEYMEGVSNSL